MGESGAESLSRLRARRRWYLRGYLQRLDRFDGRQGEQFILRRMASRFTSSITGNLPYAPVPTTSRRHFHGIFSSMESGV